PTAGSAGGFGRESAVYRDPAATGVSIHRPHHWQWNGCRIAVRRGKSLTQWAGTSGEKKSTPRGSAGWRGNPAGGRGLTDLQAARDSRSTTPADAYAGNLRSRTANRCDVVSGWAVPCLCVESRRQVRYLGSASQWGRSGSSHQGSGGKLGARLVS